MKKILSLALVLTLALALLVPGAYAADNSYAGKTVVLYTGNLRGDVDVYAKIAAVKADYEAKGADVILVDAGNYLQGTTYADSDFGLGIYNLMDAAGYDVAAMGLYEFVYGDATTGYAYHGNFFRYYTQAELLNGAAELTYGRDYAGSVTATRAAKTAATFSVLSSNVTGTESYYSFKPSTVVTTDAGLKVAFFTVTDPVVKDNVQDIFTDGYTFADPAQTAAAQAAALAGNDIVVCLSSADLSGTYGNITIKAVTGGAEAVGAYVINNATKSVSKENVTLSKSDEAVAAAVAEVKANAEKIIGTSKVTLDGSDSANWAGETNLGDLTADALKWYAENYIDGIGKDIPIVAIQNGGNCDNFLYSGDVTATDLLRALPFSPMGVGVLYLTGAQLLEALESANSPSDAYGNVCPGFAQVSGIKYTIAAGETYDAGEAYGKFYKADSINLVSITGINGKAFDKNATYAVVADNYLLNGNDTYYVFKDAKAAEGTVYINNGNGVKTRDIVALYIEKVLGGVIGTAYAAPQGRITVVGERFVNPFIDVSQGAWYYGAVKFAYQKGLFGGTDINKFSPDVTMTRSMMVTVLYRLAGSPEASAYENPFTDVGNADYADAVCWSAANGIIEGVTDDQFSPNSTITREQMAVILYRYAAFKNNDTTERADLSAYPDAAGIDPFAQAAMQWAVAEGLLDGTTTTTISPTGPASRAQVATILMRFAENAA